MYVLFHLCSIFFFVILPSSPTTIPLLFEERSKWIVDGQHLTWILTFFSSSDPPGTEGAVHPGTRESGCGAWKPPCLLRDGGALRWRGRQHGMEGDCKVIYLLQQILMMIFFLQMGEVWGRCGGGWQPVEQAARGHPLPPFPLWAAIPPLERDRQPGHGRQQPGRDCWHHPRQHDQLWFSCQWQEGPGKIEFQLWFLTSVIHYSGEGSDAEKAPAPVWRVEEAQKDGSTSRERVEGHVKAPNYQISRRHRKNSLFSKK